MTNLVVVHADFEAHWPFVADDLVARWQTEGATALIRLPRGNTQSLGEVVPPDNAITRIITLGVPVTLACLQQLPKLTEAAFQTAYGQTFDQATLDKLRSQGLICYNQRSEGFWGQSVSEFALALTLCALRQIPQNYHAMLTSHEVWERYGADRNQGPGTLGAQYSDDSRFTSGTIAGKRVRIVGAGNIGSRYASFVHMLGADVAIWDPYAPDPGFHRAGARREYYLDRLVQDAEIFVPMLPLKADTRGVVTAAHINALPTGCLVVQATRALSCDMPTLRRRVLADELALAADVFDVEPVALDDPLLGRHNVVHTPHLAGRTRDSNRQWAAELQAQFKPV